MVEVIPVRGDQSGTLAAPRDEGISMWQNRTRKPWIRALGLVRTLGINVLNKSPHGLRP